MGMKSNTKVDKKDFANLPIESWNSTTVREYIKHLNVQRFGIPSVTFNVRQENAMISRFVKEYGIVTCKKFVERCVASYKPNSDYPTVNFASMYSFMKGYELPRVLKAQQEQSRLEAIRQKAVTQLNNVEEYF